MGGRSQKGARLREELGAPPPDGLVAALSADQLEALASALAAARSAQSQALDTAMAKALDQVPRLLRGPVRKVVGG